MVEGLTEAQIVERLLRMEEQVRRISEQLGDRMGAAKLHAEQTGIDFVSARKVVNAL